MTEVNGSTDETQENRSGTQRKDINVDWKVILIFILSIVLTFFVAVFYMDEGQPLREALGGGAALEADSQGAEVEGPYDQTALVAEFSLDLSKVVVTHEGGECWNVQSQSPGNDSVAFQITNSRSDRIDGWQVGNVTGIPGGGWTGLVHAFSVCGRPSG